MASRPAPRHRRSASTARPERHNDCVFTSQTWARHATKELLRASTAVDNVCHAIVTARTAYGDGDILDELRRLALTVAVLERSLFAYADRIRIHSTAPKASSWLRRLFRRSSLFSLDVTWTGFAILLGSPLCIISILHARMRQARFRLLRELHLQLRLLQQLWSMAVEHLDEPRAGAGVPISRWTLDYVPPIGISYAEVSRSLWFLSYMLNVFYASASVWSSTSSCRWYGVPMALAAGATFGMCPQWAASVARDFLSSPRLRDVKCEWAVADAWLTKRLSPVFLSISGNAKSLDLNRFLHYKVPSGQDIRLRCLRQRGGSSMIGDMAQNLARFGSELSPIVLVVRSGSWVSNVVAADIGFLCTWAHTTGALVVAAEFPMEADHAFPDAVCDAFETYKWIVGGGLGFVPPRVVLVGDGAGGTLAASLCIQASLRCVRRPDRLILLYPALNSKAIFIPCNSSVELDFSVAPMSAPDRLLASFPPTSIVCGAIDPLVDDSIDFAHRLSSVGVFCQLKVYSKLIHGFLGFAALLPAAAGAVDLVGQWLLTGLNSRNSAGGGLVTDKVIP
ncbi:unnamed protein product (mitochondrion) [Plasmodiophora brassicae]|uniref:Alpha/beta hydrolase fold-3 domain-containing protein n=1 Tax=Plasmodiophora brassicae TaxID=37360 RepID=A0A3P3YEL0_PLABS|nr:unnamed protein product [Plasmodiophora brassicae]